MPDSIIITGVIGVKFEQGETYTYVGVVFDNALSWKENTNVIAKNARA